MENDIERQHIEPIKHFYKNKMDCIHNEWRWNGGKMYCSKCGAILEEDSLFCSTCGTKREEEDQILFEDHEINIDFTQESRPVQRRNDIPSAPKRKSKKPMNKKKLIPVLVLVILVIVSVPVLSSISKRVSVKKYLDADKITVSGYDGFGTLDSSASVVLDREGLNSALGNRKNKSASKNTLDEWLSYYDSYNTPDDYVKVAYAGDYGNLSNGDVVEVEVTVDYDKINSMGYEKKLTGDKSITLKYTVSGLEEAITIDPFSLISKVYLDTTTDYVSVKMKYTEENDLTKAGYVSESSVSGTCKFFLPADAEHEEKTFMFSIDFSTSAILDYVKSGDSIELKAVPDRDLGKCGVTLSSETKAFAVDKIEQIKDASKLSQSVVIKMKEKIEKKSESVVAAQYLYFKKGWGAEKMEFASVEFLVKSNYGYRVYAYEAPAIKVSDGGDVLVDYENIYVGYRDYAKIVDYEESVYGEDEMLKKIIL